MIMYLGQEERYYIAQEKILEIQQIIERLEGTVDGYLTEKHRNILGTLKTELKRLFDEFEF